MLDKRLLFAFARPCRHIFRHFLRWRRLSSAYAVTIMPRRFAMFAVDIFAKIISCLMIFRHYAAYA